MEGGSLNGRNTCIENRGSVLSNMIKLKASLPDSKQRTLPSWPHSGTTSTTKAQLLPVETLAAAQLCRFLLWLVFSSPPVGREVDRRGQFTWKTLSSDLKGTPELSLKSAEIIIVFHPVWLLSFCFWSLLLITITYFHFLYCAFVLFVKIIEKW